MKSLNLNSLSRTLKPYNFCIEFNVYKGISQKNESYIAPAAVHHSSERDKKMEEVNEG